MIKTFKCCETEKLFFRIKSNRFPTSIQRVALRKLLILNEAVELADLRIPPGNRLERLKGSRSGQYSIRINDQWRICFDWKDGDKYNVEIVDYH